MANKKYWDKQWKKFVITDDLIKDEYLAPEVFRCLDSYLSDNIKFLEAGCGLGIWNFMFSKYPKISMSLGVDISDSVFQAEDFRKEQKSSVCFLKGSVLELPLKSSSFDFITSFGVVEHFVDPRVPILEMMRVLKPGGILFIDTPNKSVWGLRNRIVPIDEHEDYYTPVELKNIVEGTGFEVVEAFGKGFSNTIMTVLYRIYDYDSNSFLSRLYHFFLNLFKKLILPLDGLMDNKFGFYSIVIARKIESSGDDKRA